MACHELNRGARNRRASNSTQRPCAAVFSCSQHNAPILGMLSEAAPALHAAFTKNRFQFCVFAEIHTWGSTLYTHGFSHEDKQDVLRILMFSPRNTEMTTKTIIQEFDVCCSNHNFRRRRWSQSVPGASAPRSARWRGRAGRSPCASSSSARRRCARWPRSGPA